jgi:hypothetical protein
MGWLAPYSCLGPTVTQMRGQGFLPGSVLSHGARVGGGALLGGYACPGLGCLWNVDCLGTCITNFYMECVAFYHMILTLWWNCYGVYVCIPGRVTTTDSDGSYLHT